ncbi:hypothetical protein PN462_13350 [Spirulina sp. CS-785/01]|uniref:hypothetical protein n=1 Tax=Spirulina sp. CS-785/01 TaxID=3021716 RepID=UPI00232EDFA9|nr:hypothetical protein [Spirulina sp. CS-785/01]MDB9314091.1 hypothetical protein [Spirulina sp. CS-785/01]
MENIQIQVNTETKKAFEQANPQTQKQLSQLVQFFLRENLHQKTLAEVMAEISNKAQKRGLTPEILQDILEDNDE